MSIISVTHNFGSASRGIELRLHLGWRDCLFDRISNTRSMGAAPRLKCKELLIERSQIFCHYLSDYPYSRTCVTSYAL